MDSKLKQLPNCLLLRRFVPVILIHMEQISNTLHLKALLIEEHLSGITEKTVTIRMRTSFIHQTVIIQGAQYKDCPWLLFSLLCPSLCIVSPIHHTQKLTEEIIFLRNADNKSGRNSLKAWIESLAITGSIEAHPTSDIESISFRFEHLLSISTCTCTCSSASKYLSSFLIMSLQISGLDQFFCFLFPSRFAAVLFKGSGTLNLRTLRAVRVLRPLKLVSGIPSMFKVLYLPCIFCLRRQNLHIRFHIIVWKKCSARILLLIIITTEPLFAIWYIYAEMVHCNFPRFCLLFSLCIGFSVVSGSV